MILLSIETSSTQGSLALHKNGALLGEKLWSKKSTHSELLTTSFAELLSETKTELETITHLAVGVGPGSFTGIRVGVNFARALAYARNLPVNPVDSLTIIAFGTDFGDKSILVLTSAFRNFLYYSVFKPGPKYWICTEGPGVLTFADIEGEKFKDCIIVKNVPPSAKSLGEISLTAQFKTWREVIPLYIRRSEAEEKFGICL